MKAVFVLFALIIVLCIYISASADTILTQSTSSIPSGSPFVPSAYIITARYHDPSYAAIFHKQHTGIDMVPAGYEKGNTIYLHATMDGTAYRLEEDCSGKAVLIISNEYILYFGHINTFLIQNGQHITKGQIIATMGESGLLGICVTGPHVHYQIYKKISGTFVIVDPSTYLK